MPKQYETVAELRAEWWRIRSELEKTVSHAKMLLEQYDSIQDDLIDIEKAIDQTKEELNLTEEQVVTPDDTIDQFLEDLGA